MPECPVEMGAISGYPFATLDRAGQKVSIWIGKRRL
jgi:hypothetical protein